MEVANPNLALLLITLLGVELPRPKGDHFSIGGSDHVMMPSSILAFKFLSSRVYMNE